MELHRTAVVVVVAVVGVVVPCPEQQALAACPSFVVCIEVAKKICN
jgi:hypothetical protein